MNTNPTGIGGGPAFVQPVLAAMGFSQNTATFTCTTESTAYVINTGWSTGGLPQPQWASPSAAAGTITINEPGIYNVLATLSIQSASNSADIWELQVNKNGSSVTGGHGRISPGTGDFNNVPLMTQVVCNTGDVLDLRITNVSSAGHSVVFSAGSFVVNRIG